MTIISIILDTVAAHYGIEKEEIRLKNTIRQRAEVVESKRTACYLLWQSETVNRDYICTLLDYKNATAVTKNYKSVISICSVDKSYRKTLIDLETEIEEKSKHLPKSKSKKISKHQLTLNF